MCIAIVKPRGVKVPSKETLKRCWEYNPDGGGFMYNNGNEVVIHKGFMTFNGFYKFFMRTYKLNDLENRDVVIHFRIATSGGVNKECTHPFPVTSIIENMKQLDITSEYGFAHNGVIGGYGSKTYSDTMEYCKEVINSIHDIMNSEKLIDALAVEHNSRFVVMNKNTFILGGDWIMDNGIYYSNLTYLNSVGNKYKKNFQNWYQCDWCGDFTLANNLVQTKYGFICEACYNDYIHELGYKIASK